MKKSYVIIALMKKIQLEKKKHGTISQIKEKHAIIAQIKKKKKTFNTSIKAKLKLE